MGNATRITEIKHNTAIKNKQKLITSLIARTLLPVSDHSIQPHTRTRKHSKAITPDDDLEKWDSSRTLLFKRKNLSNEDKSPEPIKRPTRFYRQPAANPNRKSRNRPDSEKKRLHLNAPSPAPSAILFQTLKRYFPKFKARMHIGMRLIVKTTNQQIAHQPSSKPAKASRNTSRKRTPKIS